MDSEQDLHFFQERLALFGKTVFSLSFMFLVANGFIDLLQRFDDAEPIGSASHVLATLIALGLWRLTRGRQRIAPGALRALDIASCLSMCACFAVMGHYFPQPWGFYTGLLAVVHTLIARAIIVPSEPRRTLLIALASLSGLVLSRAILPLPTEVSAHMATRLRGVLDAALWSAAAAALATVASKVIYGLQEKALEARQLGQYMLEEKIGEGGMGEIYRARHAMLRRPTAVKLMTGDVSEQQLRRFEREVQLTARLTHPNTISVYDYGRTPDGRFYYAMELLDGLTLEELVQRDGPQPPARVRHLLLQICGALREAHGIGLIHRDIKPANLYLCARGGIPDFIKVLDFGLVREVRDGHSDLTRSNLNTIVGTPLYLSPEAILAPDSVDARSDIYALGAVAYYLLTGTTPFTGDTVVEVCAHHLHTEPMPLSERTDSVLPADLAALVLGCLSKDPSRRPQTADELGLRLEACVQAGDWRAADARLWWSELEPKAPQTPAVVPPIAHPQRTMCCANLLERLCQKSESTLEQR